MLLLIAPHRYPAATYYLIKSIFINFLLCITKRCKVVWNKVTVHHLQWCHVLMNEDKNMIFGILFNHCLTVDRIISKSWWFDTRHHDTPSKRRGVKCQFTNSISDVWQDVWAGCCAPAVGSVQSWNWLGVSQEWSEQSNWNSGIDSLDGSAEYGCLADVTSHVDGRTGANLSCSHSVENVAIERISCFDGHQNVWQLHSGPFQSPSYPRRGDADFL